VQGEEIESETGEMPGQGAHAAGLMSSRWKASVQCAAACVIVASALTLWAGSAGAATIVVGSTQDVENGSFDDPGCTLRDAIQAANTNTSDPNGCNGDTAGADTIVLQGGKTYSLSLHAVDDTNAKGDLDITGPLTIRSSGPGLATIDAGSNTFPGPAIGADRAIQVLPTAGSVTLEGLEITDGFVEWNSKASFSGGGGILNESQLTVRDSEVAFNKVQGTGYLDGGGIYSRGSLARLTVIDSTVADNSVVSNAGSEGEGAGGGIASYESSPELTMINSTVSGNKSRGSLSTTGIVGGILAGDAGNHPTATLTHVTISGNEADYIGGIEIFAGTMTGTIVAGNIDSVGAFPQCYGGATSGGGNLIGENGLGAGDCNYKGPGDLVGSHEAPINPNLGTLVDNGGLTRTQVPNPGSPAIDRGSTCPETDQRGFFRAAGGACDAGAVEVGATLDPPLSPPSEPPGGGSEVLPPPVVAGAAPALTLLPTRAKTGKRAAALARCKKKKAAKQRAKCRARARKLPL
jgi:CSLREA domain-containing protein